MSWIFLVLTMVATNFAQAAEISFTIDDPEVQEGPLLAPVARTEKILQAFKKHQVKGALFVCGMRVDNSEGKKILKRWDAEGHLLANHSYSHLNFNKADVSSSVYQEDFMKMRPFLQDYKNYTKLYRFPYLKEGDTSEKRDAMRALLKEQGYRNGAVTIDASDWYINQRLRARLEKDPQADLKPYRDFYLKHIWERAQYYQSLAKKVQGREVKHTLLLHHNLTSALFLEDLMQMFKEKGWKLISAEEAFEDPIFQSSPATLPAGEGLVWALAKATGKYDKELRYPAEDSVYEKDEMDQLGL